MEGSGMKPDSYTFNVDKWKFIVSTNSDRMDRTSFVSIAPGIAVRADYCIRATEDRIGNTISACTWDTARKSGASCCGTAR